MNDGSHIVNFIVGLVDNRGIDRRMASIKYPERVFLPQEQLHPTDEPTEVGSHNTLTLLHERTMNYIDKKRVLEDELNAQKLQDQKVIAAQFDFTLAKQTLSEAIHGASLVTKDAEEAKPGEQYRTGPVVEEDVLDTPF